VTDDTPPLTLLSFLSYNAERTGAFDVAKRRQRHPGGRLAKLLSFTLQAMPYPQNDDGTGVN